jgi:3-oxoacyl-[acyl-carrier protein] reductase
MSFRSRCGLIGKTLPAEMMGLLDDKTAVIYGGGGAIGGAVARAFAREGAAVHLAGRHIGPVETVAAEIRANGGRAEATALDVLDQAAVEQFVAHVAEQGGAVDVSFCAIGLGDAQGTRLVEMRHEQFALPIMTAMQSQFITATAAARYMTARGSGVILAITAQVARKPYPEIGGFGVACAAIEAFCRQLAAEVGPRGVRVVCLRSSGSPDAPGVDAAWTKLADNAGVSRAAWEARMADATLLKRMPRLAEAANAAVLMGSDRASAMTAAIANVTCGELTD